MIQGKIVDQHNAALSNIEIAFKTTDGKPMKTRTDQNGRFKILLPHGIYRIEIEREGFKKFEVKDYYLPYEGEMVLDICLEGKNYPARL